MHKQWDGLMGQSAPMHTAFERGEYGHFPVIHGAGTSGQQITVLYPIECTYLRGDTTRLQYQRVNAAGEGVSTGEAEWRHGTATIQVQDTWRSAGESAVRLEREVRLTNSANVVEPDSEGIQLHLRFNLSSGTGRDWRYFAPSRLYSQGGDFGEPGHVSTFADDRLAYPLIMGYDPDSERAMGIARVIPPSQVCPPARHRSERRYLQMTDLGSQGFSLGQTGELALDLYWPYYEGEKSVALDSHLSPVSAFYPLDTESLSISLSYELFSIEAPTFADAVFAAYKRAKSLAAPRPAELPFSLDEAIDYRVTSLQKTYGEWGDDGAGFFCSFDPTRGYDSAPSGFGTSFNVIPSNDYHRILEYGFTGRQLNQAYFLATRCRGEWIERARRVCDHFVNRCTYPSGWLYSLYDVVDQRPLFSFSESLDALLHYGGRSQQAGNYLRLMVESAGDLLLNYRLFRSFDMVQTHWLETCRAFGDFLVRHQNEDGSWYRAYTPEGERVRGDQWFGVDDHAAKSGTAIPIAFLVGLAEEMGRDSNIYLDAARRAGEYVLQQHVAEDHYQGATLDNPNVVDKEAALYAMSALLALYDRLQEPAFLNGADRAARLAITWNYLWNPPFFPGSHLDTLGFAATGWGGINSIWGGGVVDIYSLFYLRDFYRLSQLTGEPLYAGVAQLIAIGTQQILSHPGDLMGFVDAGMQPEGVGMSNQGVDEGLIAKGDIWGSLGWIYSAGTFGLDAYLQEACIAREEGA